MDFDQKSLGELSLKKRELSLSKEDVDFIDNVKAECINKAKEGEWGYAFISPEGVYDYIKEYFRFCGFVVESYTLIPSEKKKIEISWRFK